MDFFPNDSFTLPARLEGRAQRVLEIYLPNGHAPLGPLHVMAAIMAGEDPQLCSFLDQSLIHGMTIQQLRQACPLSAEAAAGQQPRRKSDFTQAAQRLFTEFATRTASSTLVGSCQLEMLLFCTLKNLEGPERQLVQQYLDIPRTMALLAQFLTRPISSNIPRQSHPDAGDLPAAWADLGQVEDLSALAQALTGDEFGSPVRDAYGPALFAQLTEALHRQQARHVLLVGERGVGKHLVLAELARLAHAGTWPKLQGRRFLRLDCRFTAPEESRARLLTLLSAVNTTPPALWAADGLVQILRGEQGRLHHGLLFSRLQRAAGQLIGMLTPREFEELFAGQPDAEEFFTRVDVPEPSPAAAVPVLLQYAEGLSIKFGLDIPETVTNLAVQMSATYVMHDQLPSKAIKLLGALCEEAAFQRLQQPQIPAALTPADVVRAVARKTGVPEETLQGIAARVDYAENLRAFVVGQDQALAEVATELGLIKAGMIEPGKPASVMLFIGQTGTGKTELAKALARFYSPSRRLKTYTLGNCVEPHSVSTLIGVPPGYVGHDQGGRLVNDLNTDPYSVILLDEADKAHPDVLQPFLNLFDEGWVSDQRGVRGYADKAIFILTTNVGQRMLGDLVKQGKSWEEITDRMKETVTQLKHHKSNRPVFTPEFLARIKRFIVFRPLDEAAMAAIARKEMAAVQTAWRDRRGKELIVPEELLSHLARQAHERNLKAQGREGGRLIRKLLADWVEAPVQQAVSAQPEQYRSCQAVQVVLGGDLQTLGSDGKPQISLQFGSTEAGADAGLG